MKKDLENKKKNRFEVHYYELNEANKAKVREAYLHAFEIVSNDTFYRKMRNVTPFKRHEREFLAKYWADNFKMEYPMTDLFSDRL